MSDHSPAARNVVFETLAVARAEFVGMLLSLRAAFLLITYSVFAGGAAYALVSFDDKSKDFLKKVSNGVAPKVGLLQKFTEEATTMEAAERAKMLAELKSMPMGETFANVIFDASLPPLVVLVLYASTFVIPGLILLVGYNRISEDISTGFTRFVLQRVHRGSYLAGKVLGHWAVCALVIILVQVGLLIAGKATGVFGMDRAVKAMPQVWAGVLFFTLAYASYSAFFSSLLNPPWVVLLVGIASMPVFKLLLWLASFVWDPLGHLWLGAWDAELWKLQMDAIAVHMGYVLLLCGASYLILWRRDL